MVPLRHSLTEGILSNVQHAGVFNDSTVMTSCTRIFQKLEELISLNFYTAIPVTKKLIFSLIEAFSFQGMKYRIYTIFHHDSNYVFLVPILLLFFELSLCYQCPFAGEDTKPANSILIVVFQATWANNNMILL